MNLNYEKKDNVIVVYIESPLDIGNSPFIQKDLSSLIDQFPGYNFIVNMGQVELMNSAGIGVLIISAKKLESNSKRLKITDLNIAVKKVIQMMDVNDIIEVYDNEKEALQSFETCL